MVGAGNKGFGKGFWDEFGAKGLRPGNPGMVTDCPFSWASMIGKAIAPTTAPVAIAACMELTGPADSLRMPPSTMEPEETMGLRWRVMVSGAGSLPRST